MSEKRKAPTTPSSLGSDISDEKKAKNATSVAAATTDTGADKKKSTFNTDNIEEDDEFQEFEVYDWDTRTDVQDPTSLNFQDNWDEDANDKDFIAQLRKELGK
jgi:hypothetical protein